jgi:hypothetical protein
VSTLSGTAFSTGATRLTERRPIAVIVSLPVRAHDVVKYGPMRLWALHIPVVHRKPQYRFASVRVMDDMVVLTYRRSDWLEPVEPTGTPPKLASARVRNRPGHRHRWVLPVASSVAVGDAIHDGRTASSRPRAGVGPRRPWIRLRRTTNRRGSQQEEKSDRAPSSSSCRSATRIPGRSQAPRCFPNLPRRGTS